jgi:cytochrome b
MQHGNCQNKQPVRQKHQPFSALVTVPFLAQHMLAVHVVGLFATSANISAQLQQNAAECVQKNQSTRQKHTTCRPESCTLMVINAELHYQS